MKYIFSNLKKYWKSVLLLAVLLIVQGYCEMSMPQYTQNIIDTGIQNKGIEHIMPTEITAEEYSQAEFFMSDSQKNEWENAYRAKGDNYVLKDLSSKKLDRLDDDLLNPIVMTYQMGHMTEADFRTMMKNQLKSQMEAAEQAQNQTTAAAAKAQMEAALEKIDSMSASDIAKAYKMNVKVFTAKDEDGKKATYVDVRPALEQMIQSGQFDKSQLSQMRKLINKTVKKIGSQTMRAMGIRYASSAEEAAGVNVDKVQKNYLWASGGRMMLMALLMAMVAVAVSFVASRVGAGVGRDLRLKVFNNVIGYSNAEMDKFQTSSLITRATNDVQQVQMVTTMFLRMVLYAPVLAVWGVIRVYQSHANMSWVIALGIAVIVGIILTLVVVAMPKFKIMQKLVDRLNLVSREILTGLMVVRAFGREKEEEKRFDEANQDLKRTQLFTNRVMTFMMPAMMFVMTGLSILITWVASHRVNEGTLQVGAMTSFITYSMIIISAFMILTAMSIILPRAGVAAERIQEVINTKPSIESPADEKTPERKTGVVSFHNVSFRYPGAEMDALKDITFTAEPGKTIAII